MTYQNTVAQMPFQSDNAQCQISDMVEKFSISQNFADTLRQCAMVAHNTDQMDGFDGHLHRSQQQQRRHNSNTEYQTEDGGADQHAEGMLPWNGKDRCQCYEEKGPNCRRGTRADFWEIK